MSIYITPSCYDDSSSGGGVASVTGLNTDNSDPANPIIQISVDGTTITGNGTPGSPLVSASGGGGISSLSVIGSSPNANAATITGTTLNLQPANASFGGVVTTLAQSFAGVKTFLASPSAPGSGLNSERFGATALADGELSCSGGFNAWAKSVGGMAYGGYSRANSSFSTVFGYSGIASDSSTTVGGLSSAGGSGASAFGFQANASGTLSLACGGGVASSTGSINVGYGGLSSAEYSFSMGYFSKAQATGSCAIAAFSEIDSSHLFSLSFGYQSKTTEANQLVVGSVTGPIRKINFGSGVFSASPQLVQIFSSSGLGTNIAGANLELCPGQSTGNAKGGDFKVKISIPGSSGSSLNALLDGLIITPSVNSAPSSASDTGQKNEIRYDSDYIYVCFNTNSWKRTALSTW